MEKLTWSDWWDSLRSEIPKCPVFGVDSDQNLGRFEAAGVRFADEILRCSNREVGMA